MHFRWKTFWSLSFSLKNLHYMYSNYNLHEFLLIERVRFSITCRRTLVSDAIQFSGISVKWYAETK